MASIATKPAGPQTSAHADAMHAGDINGGFGTIAQHDTAKRTSFKQRLMAFLAILGPGLIVMVGDNDAGAFGTYTQAGQNYGTALLWTLALLIPVLYLNQEMVLRLGAVTGVGHARLILERFGRFWGAFSVIDLFVLNALTLVTEFIGISLGLGYLGLPREIGVVVAAGLIVAAAATGSFRRFERFSLLLVFGSGSAALSAGLDTGAWPVGNKSAGPQSRSPFGPAWSSGGLRPTSPLPPVDS